MIRNIFLRERGMSIIKNYSSESVFVNLVKPFCDKFIEVDGVKAF